MGAARTEMMMARSESDGRFDRAPIAGRRALRRDVGESRPSERSLQIDTLPATAAGVEENRALAEAVVRALEWGRLTPRNAIGVEARGGLIVLTGCVETSSEREEAGTAARIIPGVEGVDNRIEVLGEDVVSARLRSAAEALLLRRARRPYAGIDIRERCGRVVLSGRVGSAADKGLLLDMLGWMGHGDAIEDRLEIVVAWHDGHGNDDEHGS